MAPNMTAQLLIFDLDGTLIDSRADLATAVNGVRAHHGLAPLPLDTVTSYIGNGLRALVTRALQGLPVDIDDAIRMQARLYRLHMVDQTTLYPGVRDGLRRLHEAGHCLAMATNKPVDASEALLAHFGVRDLFAQVLGGGSTEHLKPHPEMAQLAMRQTGFAPQATWVVGDNDTDLECARRAGIRSVFCAYGFGDRRAEVPTVTVQTFDECARLFLGGEGAPRTGGRDGLA